MATNHKEEPVELSMRVSDLERIFDLAVMIDQIKIRYDSDPLVMANEAISLMQEYASEIAATVRTS